MDEYDSIISEALEVIYQKEKRTYVIESYANVFFVYESKTGSIDGDPTVNERKEKLIAEYMEKHHADSNRIEFIFNVIVNSFPNKRRGFLELFLRFNKSFEDFQKLNIEPSSWGGMGSMIPIIEEKAKFLESLLSLFSSINFLKHKIFVNNQILRWKAEIERESKKEFVDEFY